MSETNTVPTWLDAVHAFAADEAVPPTVLTDLAAFATALPRGGPPPAPEPAWAGDFASLEEAVAAPIDVAAVTAILEEEAEGAQPSIFARRAAAVERLLQDLATPTARMLRVGLRVRLRGMCEAAAPRLHRVRALADFYYSLAARLRHPEWVAHERHLGDLVAGMTWRPVKAGVEHALLDGLAEGMPVHVNVLRVDPSRVHVDVADLREETRSGRSLASILDGRACAAVSGGYFLYSEDDILSPSRRHDPVGLLITNGRVESPPVFRRGGLLVGERGVEVRRIGMADVGVRIGGRRVEFAETWSRARGRVGPDTTSVAIVGNRVLAVGRELPIPLNGFVAMLEGDVPAANCADADVTYDAPRVGGAPARAGIGGGPMLVDGGRPVLDMRGEDFWGSAPPITFSQDETGDRNLLARMALGVDGEGRLLAAAVDGRNDKRALGMTLADTSDLMIRLGCEYAVNLDGGSSKRMFVEGAVVDLPSTEIVAGESAVVRVRPLHTAILFRA